MGAVIGLLLGMGLLLIWRSGPRAPHPSSATSRAGWSQRRTERLRQAGIDGIGSSQLLAAQAACALVAGGVVLLVTSTSTVSLCFALFAFFLPTAIVSRLRRRRQVALRELWPEAVD